MFKQYFTYFLYFSQNSSRIEPCGFNGSTGVPTLSIGNMFQDPQKMLETSDIIEPHIYCFSYTYMPIIKFNL